MKYNRFASTLGAVALLLGTAWTQGGAAYAIGFTPPPDNTAPRQGTGGASRGSFFTPPSDSAAPRETTGGSSRSSFFTPPSDSAAPRETTGGSSRGDFFTPPADSAAPRETTGGSSRGDFFTPPADNTAPQAGAGGASRSFINLDGEAAANDSVLSSGSARSNAYGGTASTLSMPAASMMAITPDSFYGTTIEARPTILVYVPASNASEAVFSLKNEAKNLVYQSTLAVPESGGIVAIDLPANAPELTVGENYQWYLAMKVDNELSPASPFVDGWVKRINPSSELASRLNRDNGLADVAVLGANGVWYDTVAQLARLNETEASEEMAGHWNELLESVGLEEIATAPLVM